MLYLPQQEFCSGKRALFKLQMGMELNGEEEEEEDIYSGRLIPLKEVSLFPSCHSFIRTSRSPEVAPLFYPPRSQAAQWVYD